MQQPHTAKTATTDKTARTARTARTAKTADTKVRLREALSARKRLHETRGAEVLKFVRQQAVTDLKDLEAIAIEAYDFEPVIDAIQPHAPAADHDL